MMQYFPLGKYRTYMSVLDSISVMGMIIVSGVDKVNSTE